jgi:hypothetical protein
VEEEQAPITQTARGADCSQLIKPSSRVRKDGFKPANLQRSRSPAGSPCVRARGFVPLGATVGMSTKAGMLISLATKIRTCAVATFIHLVKLITALLLLFCRKEEAKEDPECRSRVPRRSCRYCRLIWIHIPEGAFAEKNATCWRFPPYPSRKFYLARNS